MFRKPQISETIKTRAQQSSVFFALMSENSIRSEWVMFELGAAWVREQKIIPIFLPGTSFEQVPGPVKLFSGIPTNDETNEKLSEIFMEMMKEISEFNGVEQKTGARPQQKLNNFLNIIRKNAHQRPIENASEDTGEIIVQISPTQPKARQADSLAFIGSHERDAGLIYCLSDYCVTYFLTPEHSLDDKLSYKAYKLILEILNQLDIDIPTDFSNFIEPSNKTSSARLSLLNKAKIILEHILLEPYDLGNEAIYNGPHRTHAEYFYFPFNTQNLIDSRPGLGLDYFILSAKKLGVQEEIITKKDSDGHLNLQVARANVREYFKKAANI